MLIASIVDSLSDSRTDLTVGCVIARLVDPISLRSGDWRAGGVNGRRAKNGKMLSREGR